MTFQIHPLHTPARHADVMRDQGVLGYHAWLAEGRGTGRTTSRQLAQISDAIDNPGARILLLDHEHEHVNGSTSRRQYAVTVLDICNRLHFKHMNTELIQGQYFLTFGAPK